jgi:hypothetical protein
MRSLNPGSKEMQGMILGTVSPLKPESEKHKLEEGAIRGDAA